MALEKDIAGYSMAARKHGEATDAGDSSAANKAYRDLERCWNRIRLSSLDWRPAFFSLLAEEERWVRLWAASHAVHIEADRALPILEDLSREPGFLGFSAQMTLKVFREGKLGERN